MGIKGHRKAQEGVYLSLQSIYTRDEGDSGLDGFFRFYTQAISLPQISNTSNKESTLLVSLLQVSHFIW